MKEYFLTIRKHQVKDYVSEEDLQCILKCLGDRLQFIVIDLIYEIDSKYDQLHAHLVIETNRSVYYKNHSSINGFRIYWLPANGRKRIINYMHKDSSNKYEQEQIILSNHYRHHYGFI